MSKIVRLPSLAEGLPSIPFVPSTTRALAAAALTLAAVVVAMLGGCGDPADAQGGPPHAPPVSVAPAVQRSVTDSEEFSGRLEATEYVELRPRVSGTIDKVHFVDGAFVQKGELLFTIDPRPFEAEVGARAVAAGVDQGQARTGAERARAGAEAARLAGRLAQEVDQWTSGIAHLAGRRARAPRRRCASPGSISSTPRCVRRSRARLARQHHRRQPRQRAVGADLDRRREQGLRLLRRQRADLPAACSAKRRRRKAPKVRMAPGQRAGLPARRPGSTSSTTASIRRPARSACAPASTTPRASSLPALAARLRMEDPTPYDAVLVPGSRDRHRSDQEVRLRRRRRRGPPQFREVKLGALHDGMRVVRGNVKAGRERRRRRPAAHHSRRAGRAAGAQGRCRRACRSSAPPAPARAGAPASTAKS